MKFYVTLADIQKTGINYNIIDIDLVNNGYKELSKIKDNGDKEMVCFNLIGLDKINQIYQLELRSSILRYGIDSTYIIGVVNMDFLVSCLREDIENCGNVYYQYK